MVLRKWRGRTSSSPIILEWEATRENCSVVDSEETKRRGYFIQHTIILVVTCGSESHKIQEWGKTAAFVPCFGAFPRPSGWPLLDTRCRARQTFLALIQQDSSYVPGVVVFQQTLKHSHPNVPDHTLVAGTITTYLLHFSPILPPRRPRHMLVLTLFILTITLEGRLEWDWMFTQWISLQLCFLL